MCLHLFLLYNHVCCNIETRFTKMLFFNTIRGGWMVKKQFFRFFSKTMQNQKSFSKQKSFQFLFRTFWEKKLSQFFIFVDFRHKSLFFFPVFHSPPHTIFQTKHIRIIPAVQIFYFNNFPSSKNLFYDFGTQKAHYRTHFARGR